jgi:hypothetical protein
MEGKSRLFRNYTNIPSFSANISWRVISRPKIQVKLSKKKSKDKRRQIIIRENTRPTSQPAH